MKQKRQRLKDQDLVRLDVSDDDVSIMINSHSPRTIKDPFERIFVPDRVQEIAPGSVDSHLRDLTVGDDDIVVLIDSQMIGLEAIHLIGIKKVVYFLRFAHVDINPRDVTENEIVILVDGDARGFELGGFK